MVAILRNSSSPLFLFYVLTLEYFVCFHGFSIMIYEPNILNFMYEADILNFVILVKNVIPRYRFICSAVYLTSPLGWIKVISHPDVSKTELRISSLQLLPKFDPLLFPSSVNSITINSLCPFQKRRSNQGMTFFLPPSYPINFLVLTVFVLLILRILICISLFFYSTPPLNTVLQRHQGDT